MKIAYLILIHKDPQQALRLVKRLYRDQDFFIIHVDLKAKKEDYLMIRDALKDRSNVYFTKKRYKIYYGDVSLVDSSMECMKVLSSQQIDYDYAIMISGQHYPLVSSDEIDRFLTQHKGTLFMTFFTLPYAGWHYDRGGFDRYERWHFVLFGIEIRFPGKYIIDSLKFLRRSFPKGYHPYGGLHWFCAPKEAIDYLLGFISKNGSFVRFFKHVFIPNEMFFQTVFLNSPLKENVIADDQVLQKWIAGKRHPEIYTSAHMDELMRSGKLFARKFDAHIDADILDSIDNYIDRNRSQEKT